MLSLVHMPNGGPPMRSMLLPLVVALSACSGGGGGHAPTSTSSPSESDTGSDPTDTTSTTTEPTDTASTDTGSTDTATDPTGPGPLTCVEGEEILAPGVITRMWMAPGGDAIGLGSLGSSFRAPDGTWTTDPDLHAPWTPEFVDGDTIDEVWASNRLSVWRRDATSGTWDDMGFPGVAAYIVGLSVEAPDDVLVITADLAFDTGYQATGVLTLHSWDGSSWSADVLPVDQAVFQADRLPDGRIVALGYDRLEIQNGSSMDPLPVPPGFVAYDLRVAGDGALLAFGNDVAIGDASGLSVVSPAPSGVTWRLGAIGELEDVWLVGWDPSSNDAVATHWDGTSWTHQTVPDSLYVHQIAARGSTLLLADSDPARSRVRSLDAGVITTELDPTHRERLAMLAVDDVSGEIWNFGEQRAARFDGSTWVDDTHPFGGLEWGGLPALSDGKGVLAGHGTLYFTDGVTLTADDVDGDDAQTAVAASSGTVFVFGERWQGASVVGHFGRSNDGSGWTPLAMNGMPAGARLTSAWADAPDDVWIGYGTTTGGGLVHHDGTSATVVDSSLPSAPTSMRRGVDGTLWLSLADMLGGGDGMWVWDGTTMSRVPDLPDHTSSVYQVSDGTTFVTTFDEGTDLAQVLRSGPSGWEVASEGLDMTRLVGHGDTVVAGRHAGLVSWSAVCAP